MLITGKSNTFSVTQNALEADAQSIVWYSASSGDIDVTGSTINSWTDLSGNGFHLTQEGSVTKPTYSAANQAVVFTGSEVLSNGSFLSADGWDENLTGGSGEFTAYFVIKPVFTDSGTNRQLTMICSGETTGGGGDDISYMRVNERLNDTGARLAFRSRAGSDFYNTNLSFDESTLHDAISNTLCLVKFNQNQTTSTFSLNDGAVWEGTSAEAVVDANVPVANDRLYVGAFCSAADALAEGFDGEIREIFITNNPSNDTDVTNYLLTKYGL